MKCSLGISNFLKRSLVFPILLFSSYFFALISEEDEKVSVSCSVLSDSLRPHGLSLPGSSVHGIIQARILEWVAIPCVAGGFFTTVPLGNPFTSDSKLYCYALPFGYVLVSKSITSDPVGRK